MLSNACLSFKTKSISKANFALLYYFRLIRKKKIFFNKGKILGKVLPLKSAVLSQISAIDTKRNALLPNAS